MEKGNSRSIEEMGSKQNKGKILRIQREEGINHIVNGNNADIPKSGKEISLNKNYKEIAQQRL